MCKKCTELKKIWWKKKTLSYDLLSERNDAYHINAYEVASSWKALWQQRDKHVATKRQYRNVV